MTCNGAHMMRQISVHNEDKVTSGILDTVYVGSPYQGVIQDFEVEGGNKKSNQKMLLKKRSSVISIPL